MRTTTTSLSIGSIGRALQALPAAVAWLLTLVVPAACSIIDEGPDALSGAETQVVFTLRLDAPTTPATKATWGDNYNKDDGTSYENTIDPATLQVVICPTNGSAYYPLQNLSLTSGDASNSYTFVGSIDVNQSGLAANQQYKIMVLANCPEADAYADLDDLTYTYTHSDSPTGYLPMWGVTTATLTLAAGERQTLTDPIDLLRAVAKVEVQLSGTNVADYELTGATLTRANTQGYCLPAGWNGVDNTKELERQEASGTTPGSYRPYATTDAINNLTFSSIENEDGSTKYIVYLPERDNTQTPAEITVKVQQDGKEEEYPLYFQTYTNGRPVDGTTFNIVRNHLYRYNITAIENGQLTVQHRVMPWNKVTSKWNTGTYEYLLLPKGGDAADAATGDPEAIFGIVHKPTYDNSNDYSDYDRLKPGTAGALYQFQLKAPTGAIWTAHLTNNEDFYFSYSTIDTNGDDVDDNKMASAGIARDAVYYIQINARNPWQAIKDGNGNDLPNDQITFESRSPWGAQVEAEHRVVSTYFYITVSTDGGTTEEELEINPARQNTTGGNYFNDNRRFPGTATRIWVRQVPVQKGRGENNPNGTVWNAHELARNVNPADEDFQWWRVNPYWSPTASTRFIEDRTE